MAGVDTRTVQTLMGHKTLTMTERYAHLSPAHKLAAMQRLNQPEGENRTATTTATEPETTKTAVEALPEVVELSKEKNGPRRSRTCDPLIKRSREKRQRSSPSARHVTRSARGIVGTCHLGGVARVSICTSCSG